MAWRYISSLDSLTDEVNGNSVFNIWDAGSEPYFDLRLKDYKLVLKDDKLERKVLRLRKSKIPSFVLNGRMINSEIIGQFESIGSGTFGDFFSIVNYAIERFPEIPQEIKCNNIDYYLFISARFKEQFLRAIDLENSEEINKLKELVQNI